MSGDGTGRRGSYHHGNLPTALAEAAARLAREGGPEAVVLREAARRVGVSPTAAYRHFANHDDLLHAVKDAALAALAERMEAEIAAVDPLPDPVAEAVRRLRAIGTGYLRFALAEPGLFRTAFCRTEKAPGEELATDVFAVRPYQLLSETLDTLDGYARIRPGRREYAEVAAWACVHGLAMLLLDGPLRALPDAVREAAIRRTVDAFIDSICEAD